MKLQLKHLKALKAVTSTAPSRPVLQNIGVEINGKGAITLMACDGKCALMINAGVTTDAPGRFMLNPPLNMLKGDEVTVTHLENDDTYETGDVMITRKPVAGDFPNLRNVVPNGEFTPVELSINAALLSKLMQAAKLLSSKNGMSANLYLRQHGDSKTQAYSVLFDSPDYYGLIMPLMADTQKIPDFVKP